MARLILVRHAMPRLVAEVPARDWHLGDEGRSQAALLAERLAPYRPTRVITSTEPKAQQTGEAIAARFGLPVGQAEGLHEHERSRIGWISREQMEQGLMAFYSQPDRLAFGEESADAAYARFSAAVERLVAEAPSAVTVAVTHGTVLALFLSRRLGLEPYPLQRRFGFPAFVVLTKPDLRLLTVVESL